MNKEFWVEKGSAHTNDEDEDFGNAARIGPKRPHPWFLDATEADLYPSKKQELQISDCKPASEMLYPAINPWDNPASHHPVSNQFMDRLFGNESPSSINFAERNLSSVGRTDTTVESRKENDIHFRDGIPIGYNISRVVENPQACQGYAGIEKLKVSQVKEYDPDVSSSIEPVHPFNRESETSFVSIGDGYYNGGNASVAPNYVRGDENTISIVDHFAKVDSNVICFDNYPDEQDLIPIGRPLSSYEQLSQPTSLISDTAREKRSDSLTTVAVLNSSHVTKTRIDSVSKNHPEAKTPKKRAPNSFPSNVRSLISTGMLDGVPVKYVFLGREELRGVIKGSGYLCGCQTCNYTEVLNAYEFERHAGCKTKHPNNHVYFENGKTIYQIVQELRNTPTSLLFDAIQTVFGAPINQKSFRIWKESFQAATRELQRIYGKEELNL